MTTGTGSGKTESFLIPVLDHCRRQKALGLRGVKAVLLYPMNALATDQAGRIGDYLAQPELAQVTAGLYIGDKPDTDFRRVMTRREEMRQSPPDVLITNYKMLDLLLQRAEDRPLWEGADPVSRTERAEIWQLAERFAQRLDRLGMQTWDQVAERAAQLEAEQARRIQAVDRRREEAGGLDNVHVADGSGGWLRYRYRHIVIDEAQDLRPAHWKMLRAMTAPDRNDLFLVGDTHQRIYKNQVTLGSLGINIRGRSSKLSLSYRTTRQILRSALNVLGDETYDDLDGSSETLAGYRSVLSGAVPDLHRLGDWEAEREAIAALIGSWGQVPHEQIAIAVPTNQMASETASTLARHGIRAVEIGPDGPRGDGGVHIGTMFRFKGLEYQRMIIAGVSDGLVPRAGVKQLRNTDAARHRLEMQRARSLLFVAATRARDSLDIFWHGDPSPFLEALIEVRPPVAA